MKRRSFIKLGRDGFFASLALSLPGCMEHAGVSARRRDYGALTESADCPELLIPPGFRCVRISTTRSPSLADPNFIVPYGLDGMGAFALANGNVRLVRNHEGRDPASEAQPILGGSNCYDQRAAGGTTSLELAISGSGSALQLQVLAEYVSLDGTAFNCAGGATPWQSWLTCEETTQDVAQGRTRPHGYIFEVPASASGAVIPTPLRAMGRFVHEAAAVEPLSGVVYETEDRAYNPDSNLPGAGFYRFIPGVRGSLQLGGVLQALAVVDRPNYITVRDQTVGARLPVHWVTIDDADPANAAADPSAVFKQALARGAAIFDRLEGCCADAHKIYFDATSGGNAGLGQIWRYEPLSDEPGAALAGHLTLLFESSSRDQLANPDNMCVSPRGGLVVCEDTTGVKHIRGFIDGEMFPLVQTNADLTEFAGSCFSPRGDALFFNVQGAYRRTQTAVGATYALSGPWEAGGL